ncbi:MAG TPA: serine hydrolase domain-containing protein, partial [Deinococcales bacterium]|nr:serine hydrolase domain-containing protein [Deinococcales bacterium]
MPDVGRYRAVFAVVEQAVHGGLVPGAALAVLEAGSQPLVAHWGKAQAEPEVVTLERSLHFDLASLTKVLCTVPEVLRLVEDGLADLDDPLSQHLPELAWMQDTPLKGRTLRQLLTHTSGLPAWRPLYTWGGPPETLKARLLQEPWELGEDVYSDINFMLLGLLVERLRGEALAARSLPEGLAFHPDAGKCVATMRCPWRGRVLRGEPDDENAAALGGAAGHAGLFGTVDGLTGFARAVLDGSLLSPAALAEMARPHTDRRALGWERRYPGWSGGSLCSPATIGHTGFTGTGLWIDRERGLAWALLSNRTHPTRHGAPDLGHLRRA